MKNRIILHCDINNAYASIECLDHPEWRGRPLIVCGDPKNRNGIVLAKSNEAKKFGVKTGEAIWEAESKCPDLLKVPPRYDLYLKYSKILFSIYNSFTPQVEAFGLDECWLDVTGTYERFAPLEDFPRLLQDRVLKETGLPLSIGVSFNKHFAKLGSDMKKPLGISFIPPDSFEDVIGDLPVSDLMGIGPATTRKLARLGVHRLGDLARAPVELLEAHLGVRGRWLWDYANGRDDSPVATAGSSHPIKSLGQGWTLRRDAVSREDVRAAFLALGLRLSARLRLAGLMPASLAVHVRDSELKSQSFQGPLIRPSLLAKDLSEGAWEIFSSKYREARPIRSLGIRAIDLRPASRDLQGDLFFSHEGAYRQARVEEAIFDIRERFGKESLSYASLLDNDLLPERPQEVLTLPIAMERNR